jgi:signal transduction histidine kinase/CheY-like chemotaxis protein/predicted hydrocarbon binding protein
MSARKKKMPGKSISLSRLQSRLRELEKENKRLKKFAFIPSGKSTVIVPDEHHELFKKAEHTVNSYFRLFETDPSRADIRVGDERYLLIRAEALAYDFMQTILKLYTNRDKSEAWTQGHNILFDLAHSIGITDAKNFHKRMKVKDPIAKLSAGPVHFAYSGWAKVDILTDSIPSPDDNFFLIYNHPYSFESDSWINKGKKSPYPVCIMNAGYSSGWCEASFGIPLTAVEVCCKARGDDNCTFIMAPPHRIHDHLAKYIVKQGKKIRDTQFHVPAFFERKKIEEEMELARKKAVENDQAKTDFLANMSHEIRTPLTTIMGYIDLLQQENLNKKEKKYVDAIKDSSNHLRQLITEILDLSKIEAGQMFMEKIPVHIADFLNSIKKDAQQLLGHKSEKIKIVISKYPGNPKSILCDPTRIRQIIYNLLENAIKFTQKGKIEIGAGYSLNKQRITFYVKDSGIGIDKKHQKIIFKKFAQADTTITRKYGGSGLGLTISYRLAELLGGKLKLKSDKGKGSEFSFTIQVDAETAHTQIMEAVNTEADKKRNLILLVEDNITNRNLTKLILERNGFYVITASNGKQAYDTFVKVNSLHAVLMDIQMPVMDGFTATQKIRKWEKKHGKKPTPIVALTAHALKEDAGKSREAGCSDYLTKPIEISSLLSTLARHLK